MTTPINYHPASLGPTGMLQQTAAIFLDAYRELQSRKLFWITLALSAVVVLAFGAVGFDAAGFSVFGKHFDNDLVNTATIPAAELYKTLFINLGVQWWLSWIGIILALVSTAPMIPDFVSGGAVDLYLARPLGRTRLFLTKYIAGLLFVALQVSIFCLASFLVIGLRGGAWVPGLFIAVPLVTLLFSYLWAVCALIGLVTRSTIASLLLTLLVWFICFGLHATESSLLFMSVGKQVEIRDLERQISVQRDTINRLTTRPAATQPKSFESKQLQMAESSLTGAEERLKSSRESALDKWHRAFYLANYPLPKTAETSALVERTLQKQLRPPRERRHKGGDEVDEDTEVQNNGFLASPRLQREAAIEVAKTVRARSLWYVLGTSLTFEAVILLLAAWIFARRDF